MVNWTSSMEEWERVDTNQLSATLPEPVEAEAAPSIAGSITGTSGLDIPRSARPVADRSGSGTALPIASSPQ